MTTISDPDELVAAVEPLLLDKEKSRSRLAVAVCVGLTLFALLNATAAVYLYRGINDLRALEARLEDLGQFEQRMSARLDTVNNGFQSRFEALDDRLRASFGEVNANIARQAPEMSGNHGGDEPRVVELSPPVEAPAAVASASEPDAQPAVEDLPRAPRRRPAPAVPPAPSSNYQRIVSPEGKVTYHKIN
ncbi:MULTISPECIES: hypothetical protein [unclassified Mesorhizobium]|uniref:hypothetical protein n=1 Tax=unclassified Mesorhizobium TaxID=325217 RepID=UPI001127FE0B|nr:MULTISPECIES: hypothetical protein [unclassified Mesorhizobium]TPK85390.1 hypothetical protein FJ548_16260 [Mesorhizobium sp. B2-4-17]UCI30535.1 hypothetical protein FJW03_22395 [Mesorhizobium sp. B4-1-4]